MDSSNAVIALGALAQGSRLAIFRHLVEAGPQGAHPGDIAHRLDVPANTLSFHLKALSHAGLIQAEQQGRFVLYRANFVAMQALVGFLTENCCGGDPGKCAPVVPGICAVDGKAAGGEKRGGIQNECVLPAPRRQILPSLL